MRALRRAKGWTLRQLELLTGINYSVLCLYETGKRRPRPAPRAKIAAALRTTPEHLWPELYGVADSEAVA